MIYQTYLQIRTNHGTIETAARVVTRGEQPPTLQQCLAACRKDRDNAPRRFAAYVAKPEVLIHGIEKKRTLALVKLPTRRVWQEVEA